MNEEYYNKNKMAGSSSLYRDRSPNTFEIDKMIRQKLRVSDPKDSREIANALVNLYTEDKYALEREAAGLSYISQPLFPEMRQPAETATYVELEQAKKDVERDLHSLITHSGLKDIESEIRGWAQAIRTAIAEGVSAARLSLDPGQRDKAFLYRRILGDYARIIRFVGALSSSLTISLNHLYRRLAQSLDEVSAVILVMMGDALANVGFNGGRFFLQAPVSELQERRDTVIFALRNFIGTTQEAYGSDKWPRGLVAYQQLLQLLKEHGQHDIRALLRENELARLMDDLIHGAADGTAEGLRALGSTAQIVLERFRRFITFAQGRLIEPQAPPLSAFLAALRLFLEPFERAESGRRLLVISRPPVVFYGLYGLSNEFLTTDSNNASRRLLALIEQRGIVADHADGVLGSDITTINQSQVTNNFVQKLKNTGNIGRRERTIPNKVFFQIVIDKLLYDIDRAVDLYALGTEEFGDTEQRAAAYGYLLHVLEIPINVGDIVGRSVQDNLLVSIFESLSLIMRQLLFMFIDDIGQVSPPSNVNTKNNIVQELCAQLEAEKHWESLLRTMAPSHIKFIDAIDVIRAVINETISFVTGTCEEECPPTKISIPDELSSSVQEIKECICPIQEPCTVSTTDDDTSGEATDKTIASGVQTKKTIISRAFQKKSEKPEQKDEKGKQDQT